jgi:hypothetical protein
MFNQMASTLDLHQQISGMHDSLVGERPAGITSAMGIEALRETALVRVRHKIKQDIMPMMKRMAKYVEHIIKTYDTEVVEIRKMAESGMGYEYLKFDPTQKYDKQTKKFFKYERGMNIKPSDIVSLEDTQMDIIIELGRGFEEGSVAKEIRAIELFDKGIYPFPMMINDMRFSPDRKKELIMSWNNRNQVISMIGQFKQIADRMTNNGIKNSQDWINSPELKQLQGLLKQLSTMNEKQLLQTKV